MEKKAFLVNVCFSATVSVEAETEDEALDIVFDKAAQDGLAVMPDWDKDNISVEILNQD